MTISGILSTEHGDMFHKAVPLVCLLMVLSLIAVDGWWVLHRPRSIRNDPINP